MQQKPTNASMVSVPVTPIRCLVIQLARTADVLQSLMALRAAKELYPQIEIHLLAREQFSAAAKRVPWISQVVTLPTEQIILPLCRNDKQEIQALQELSQWLIPLVEKPWDMIINWTFSESSSFLTSLLPGRVKLGYTRRKDLSLAAADGWSNYVQGIVQEGIPQNIHMTDILTTQFLTALQIHLGDPAPAGNQAVTSQSFFSLTVSANQGVAQEAAKRWIGIQLDTSEHTWDMRQWAQFITIIHHNHPEYGIYLFGSQEDIPMVQEILKLLPEEIILSPSFVCLVGKTHFDLWVSTLSSCQWLFSCNSAAIYFAAILGIRVIQILLDPPPSASRHYSPRGQTHFYASGVYGNGHYILSTANDTSIGVNAETLYATWVYANNEWRHQRKLSIEDHFHVLGISGREKDIQIYRSQIRPAKEGGGVRYEPLIERPLPIEIWASYIVGYIARAWYCGWVPDIGKELTRSSITPAFLKQIRQIQEATEALTRIYGKACQTASALKAKTANLKSDNIMGLQDRIAVQELATTLAQLDELVERVVKLNPQLACFQTMSKVLMHNLNGSQITELSQEATKCYKQLNEGVALYQEWIKFTLKLAKPVVIPLPISTPVQSQTV